MKYNQWKLSHEAALKCWWPDVQKIIKFTGKKYGAVQIKASRLGLTGTYKNRVFTGYKKTPT
jgi:hypothetical protein